MQRGVSLECELCLGEGVYGGFSWRGLKSSSVRTEVAVSIYKYSVQASAGEYKSIQARTCSRGTGRGKASAALSNAPSPDWDRSRPLHGN